ncbi:Peptidyl-prolyl cis-trans isomerase NIMA-interacting 4 [Wallemia ichthyophaga EXF-994]|uniref:Peptidyl-prolyl cis-trans isomerase n=1 Tax=Wallemia ichthyophaga (strain EXF-994 / CBS 113033) TaxID=1299270 RepID=R9AHL9_WALI9|nr:Peptidyl-prolyl cis-trans isomerase NIMA-interacting 4 [Wallemia ichthyophaga EXF-994]EOR01683.1 Peptidyl-prolyl cis-trans isomerase NIMA-interacting 4 [Wallemia ichthyophaga EXF-994]TIB37084.1 hypothetical protein E3P84_00528 [Wallemia ichthyophaga]TIB43546.1 hypothetical protein E3P83_00671 [Wallemia ichthyophaga]
MGKKQTGAQAIQLRHVLTDKHSKAVEALDKIKNGENFAKIAMEYSQDKARAGGLLGLKQKTDLVEPISSTAFNLPVNQPSDPVKSEFGYHILLVEARK